MDTNVTVVLGLVDTSEVIPDVRRTRLTIYGVVRLTPYNLVVSLDSEDKGTAN